MTTSWKWSIALKGCCDEALNSQNQAIWNALQFGKENYISRFTVTELD